MKKTFVILASALLALASCEEWEPVFTGTYDDVYMYEPQELEVTATIAELKDLYAKHGVLKIEDDDMVISGKIISDDHSGNIYRELYIQDETGVISVKLGLTSLYCDYKLGQTVYVKCMSSAAALPSVSTTACRSWAWRILPASMRPPIWTTAT